MRWIEADSRARKGEVWRQWGVVLLAMVTVLLLQLPARTEEGRCSMEESCWGSHATPNFLAHGRTSGGKLVSDWKLELFFVAFDWCLLLRFFCV